MTNTPAQDKSLSWENFAIVCFIVIAISTLVGLIALPKKEGENLTLPFWTLMIPFVVSGSFVGCWILESIEGFSSQDKKPDSLADSSEDDRGARSDDLQVHTHNIWPVLVDRKLAIVAKDIEEIAQRVIAIDKALAEQTTAKTSTEVALKEQQARGDLIAKFSDFGTGTNPLEVLQQGLHICSNNQTWIKPAKIATIYQDTERFYREGRIWLTVRDDEILWNVDPDFDPLEVQQTPFRPFYTCSRCKYFGEDRESCAVAPFGCTGDPILEKCFEFVSEDDIPY